MSFIHDLGEYLEDQGIATLATNMFIGHMPDTPNSIVALYSRQGTRVPDKYIPTADPGVQIMVRNSNYATGQAIVESIVSALHQLANVELQSGQTYLYAMSLQGEVVHLGRDGEGRDEWSLNFSARLKR